MANSHSQNDDVAAVRRHLRSYELSLDRLRRKRFGQYFTGGRAASLLAALSVTGREHTIVDPMAGHGDLLDAVAERCAQLGQHVSLTAVEIDEPVARLAEERLTAVAVPVGHQVEVLNRDAFSPDIWSGSRAVGTFDLVIANPPYVRYQAHSEARANEPIPTTSTAARTALRTIAQSVLDSTERHVWMALIDGYSGLADLSVPSWILCAMLVKPGGTLALVVPKTWMSRDYATVLQYLQLRFFEPQCIVEEHGIGWFEDALVPTTLVVARRRTDDGALLPLIRRAMSQSPTIIAAVRSTAADERSLIGRAFPDPAPDIAFAQWLSKTESHAGPHITVRQHSWSSQTESVLARARHEPWFEAVGESSATVDGVEHRGASVIPAEVVHALSPSRPRATLTLEALGYDVGQGLRTGCNAFFYVDAVGPPTNGHQAVRLSPTLGGTTISVPQEILRPVIRRQSDVPGFSIDDAQVLGRVLVLSGWELPENAPPGHVKIMPQNLASMIRLAATTDVGTPDRRVLIPELSAVRTNARLRSSSAALFEGASASRRWYMLPAFAPRHLPALAIPRVNSGTPYVIANTERPTLIDANFSTIYGASFVLPPLALLAILNSTWSQVCAECLGTPMGGGALKFEATQLRMLPIPTFTTTDTARLTEIGRTLAAQTQARTNELLPQIDEIVFASLFSNRGDIDSARTRLHSLLSERREQRVRAPREAAF